MLTEQFVASIGAPAKSAKVNVTKDAGIYIHEYQPLVAQRATFKKSATPRNGLAISGTHIFAAQTEKAVVHVYSRERGNQEATVPFTERITCTTLICADSILALGTHEGRIFLWELCTGRLVATAQSHLQAVTALAVDQKSNFLLSASADSTIHVWSILSLLSFSSAGVQQHTPLRTFTSHRAEVSDIAVGHSSSFCNFAVSVSKDRTCLIWDYHTNGLLRTYLLPSAPICVTLDPADRAVYIGYDDGSLQQIDLYQSSQGDSSLEAIQDNKHSTVPRQPLTTSHWKLTGDVNGSVLSISLSFDGCTLLAGYESGAVVAWDVASGRAKTNILQGPLPGPVITLSFMKPINNDIPAPSHFRIPIIVKPKVGAFDSTNGLVPGAYTMSVELSSRSTMMTGPSYFQEALTAPTFSTELLDKGLQELAMWHNRFHAQDDVPEDTGDFVAFTDDSTAVPNPTPEQRNADLEAQVESLRRLQKASFDKIEKLSAEKKALLHREHQRLTKRVAASKSTTKVNGTSHGRANADTDMVDLTDDSSEG